MSVNKAPLEWRQRRIERCLEPLVYLLTGMPVGKPSLVKGWWQASFKYVLFSHRRNKPKRYSTRSTKLHILKASVVRFGGRSAEYRVQLREPL